MREHEDILSEIERMTAGFEAICTFFGLIPEDGACACLDDSNAIPVREIAQFLIPSDRYSRKQHIKELLAYYGEPVFEEIMGCIAQLVNECSTAETRVSALRRLRDIFIDDLRDHATYCDCGQSHIVIEHDARVLLKQLNGTT